MKIEHIIAVGGRHWLRHAGGDPCFYLEVASDHCPVCRAERERDEARKALRLLADEVDVGRRDCQCGDLNCQHVAITDGLLAAIYECCIAARAAGGGGDE